MKRRTLLKLAAGLYEQLVTHELAPLLEGRVADVDPPHPDAPPDLLARHLFEAFRRALSGLEADDQLALTNRVLTFLAASRHDDVAVPR